MEKRKDIKGYILYHKDVDYGIWDNSLYTPKSVFDGELGRLNGLYCELSGTYDIWKTHPKDAKYILHCQYRRRIEFPEDFDFDQLFNDYDVVAAWPATGPITLREQYFHCHNILDLAFMEEILKEMHPEYAEDWDNLINKGHTILYSHGFVMKTEDFDNYCEWIFGLFDEFRKRTNMHTMEDVREHLFTSAINGGFVRGLQTTLNYQLRIFGYLAERLYTVWIFHNYKRIKFVEYAKMEKGMVL